MYELFKIDLDRLRIYSFKLVKRRKDWTENSECLATPERSYF